MVRLRVLQAVPGWDTSQSVEGEQAQQTPTRVESASGNTDGVDGSNVVEETIVEETTTGYYILAADDASFTKDLVGGTSGGKTATGQGATNPDAPPTVFNVRQLKGSDDVCSLCSDTATFQVRKHEFSNSMYLAQSALPRTDAGPGVVTETKDDVYTSSLNIVGQFTHIFEASRAPNPMQLYGIEQATDVAMSLDDVDTGVHGRAKRYRTEEEVVEQTAASSGEVSRFLRDRLHFAGVGRSLDNKGTVVALSVDASLEALDAVLTQFEALSDGCDDQEYLSILHKSAEVAWDDVAAFGATSSSSSTTTDDKAAINFVNHHLVSTIVDELRNAHEPAIVTATLRKYFLLTPLTWATDNAGDVYTVVLVPNYYAIAAAKAEQLLTTRASWPIDDFLVSWNSSMEPLLLHYTNAVRRWKRLRLSRYFDDITVADLTAVLTKGLQRRDITAILTEAYGIAIIDDSLTVTVEYFPVVGVILGGHGQPTNADRGFPSIQGACQRVMSVIKRHWPIFSVVRYLMPYLKCNTATLNRLLLVGALSVTGSTLRQLLPVECLTEEDVNRLKAESPRTHPAAKSSTGHPTPTDDAKEGKVSSHALSLCIERVASNVNAQVKIVAFVLDGLIGKTCRMVQKSPAIVPPGRPALKKGAGDCPQSDVHVKLPEYSLL